MEQPILTLTTDKVRIQYNRPGSKLIDVRSPDAYNGWRMENESRGGHIPGAKSLPAYWAEYIDWPEIVANKQIDKKDTLIIYGYDAVENESVAKRFSRAGYPKVYLYNDFLKEWLEDARLPLDTLERYRHLVPASWVKALIDGKNPQEHGETDHVICHAHYRNPQIYDEGHIPGAVALDTNLLESPQTWNRRSPEELKNVLESLGITHKTTVILYGRFASPDPKEPFPGSSAGHLGAMRCAFLMLYAGVKDVRILNGGLQSWIDAGYSLSQDVTPKEYINNFGTSVPGNPELAIDTPAAKDVLESPDANLVSVRSWPEFIGETSGYNYIEKKGRIPGAVFGNCGQDAYHMENYRNPDHTCREYPEIAAVWAKAGITPEKFNAFYCGTGWRASEAFFNAWLMGWDHIAAYDGGWFEWSQDPNNPYETGMPSTPLEKETS
jgi:thiosulfate/3-mercaptopyruvate sulfurtransferase